MDTVELELEKAQPQAEDRLGLMGRRDFSLLVVDDSAGLRQEVVRLAEKLKVFKEVRQAENGIDALKKVHESSPDLILCDLVMPTVDGLKFLTMLYARPEMREIPVIILTGRTDVDTKIKGLELGASDYVTKPFDEGELLARIKVQLKIKALQDRLKIANRELWELSTVDPLTKLYNRRYFMDRLEYEFKRAKRYGHPLSFVMLDIDHFKNLNDTYGHQVGDEVLSHLGGLLAGAVREIDTPGRYGGEEFCLLLPQTDLEGAISMASRVNETVRSSEIETGAGTLTITVSVGVSAVKGMGLETAADLIKVTDEALYRAKEEGRDRVVAAGPHK